ncbi:VirK/YbjX family protein [Candidatus Pantoea carbekii]|uniref:Uncharacterized protein n=1 Tax=Candidatus Pantoea carbekii TaxID=1235990 RepID=U3U6P9_9GAMM|nr:VirK/YbjX family protein [Candidatus Pantoea carbekii]AKC32279.1 protein YbjX [Candidatus Pantoea carbekii]BAN99991.1 hypothetical protein HHS_00220 [Candidatus Pantoea carbekii]
MSTIKIHFNKNSSLLSICLSLISGKFRPHNLWKSKKFRIKFLLRFIVFPVVNINYFKKLAKLPMLHELLVVQGLLVLKPHRPYLHIGLSMVQRAQAIIDHYTFIDKLDNCKLRQLLQNQDDVMLANFDGKNGEKFSINFCPGLFEREGEIMLYLQFEGELITSLSFSIILRKNQEWTIVIGGLQGPRKNISNTVIRTATKSLHGLFPKRLLMEVIFILAALCKVRNIVGVSDTVHVFHSLRYRYSKRDKLFASYSDFWLSLGGEIQNDGLFKLPLCMVRKDLKTIASKKRAEYRRRYTLLDNLTKQIYQASM